MEPERILSQLTSFEVEFVGLRKSVGKKGVILSRSAAEAKNLYRPEGDSSLPAVAQNDMGRIPPTILRRAEFVIIGGVAAAAQGSVCPTYDLDLCYRRTPENLERLVKALAPLHPRLRGVSNDVPFRWNVRTLELGLNFALQTDAGAIDLAGEVTGLGAYDRVLTTSEVLELYGEPVRVLTLEGLITAKRAIGRPRDREHLLELEALLELRRQPPDAEQQ